MTWYKVVRPDMSSFADPKFKYRIGAARLAPKAESRVLCEPGLLHASPSPPEAARYGRWPYRLLEVDPEGAEPVARQEDKAGFLRLKVVARRPVSECFGPNGEAVLRVIGRVEHLTADEADRLAAAWAAARATAVYAAWAAARATAVYAAWAAARDAAGSAARYAAWDAAWDAARYAARDAAGYAARAEAVADLIGQHGFTQDHFDLLVGQWRDVIGPTWETPG